MDVNRERASIGSEDQNICLVDEDTRINEMLAVQVLLILANYYGN